ncbi:MAG: hypothetical protein ACOCZC_01275 [Halodesulfurarchaeum sp.]
MSLVEFSVDRIDVQTVPKFVLFGGDEVAETGAEGSRDSEAGRASLPVSVGAILAVSIAVTLLAVLAVRALSLVGEDLNLHC